MGLQLLSKQESYIGIRTELELENCMDGGGECMREWQAGKWFCACDKAVSRIKGCVVDLERTMIRRNHAFTCSICDKWRLARRSLQIN